MLISQSAEYALRAAVWLGCHKEQAQTTQQIAEGTKVPSGYLSKILQALGRAKLVTSQRGIGGGFKLTRSPAELTVLDVVNAVAPIGRIARCPLDRVEHATERCALHKRLDDAVVLVENALRNTTIAELEGTFHHHPFGDHS